MLRKTYSHPIEREYEGWIVAGIEQYFRNVGLNYAIWAVSPDVEKVWPADEQLLAYWKLVGLQIKQAKLGAPKAGTPKGADPAFDRLRWDLSTPKGQFVGVKSTQEIFYCLPTFLDRSYRFAALHHCLFWRPSDDSDTNLWYDNPNASTPYRRVCDGMRWGRFLERVLSCDIGVKKDSLAAAVIHSRSFLPAAAQDTSDRDAQTSAPYAVAVALGNG